jgi:hypothetical protein
VPLFLREHGTWFFLVPVFWVSYACYALQIDRGWMSFKIAQVVGISIILKRKMGALVDPF